MERSSRAVLLFWGLLLKDRIVFEDGNGGRPLGGKEKTAVCPLRVVGASHPKDWGYGYEDYLRG